MSLTKLKCRDCGAHLTVPSHAINIANGAAKPKRGVLHCQHCEKQYTSGGEDQDTLIVVEAVVGASADTTVAGTPVATSVSASSAAAVRC